MPQRIQLEIKKKDGANASEFIIVNDFNIKDGVISIKKFNDGEWIFYNFIDLEFVRTSTVDV